MMSAESLIYGVIVARVLATLRGVVLRLNCQGVNAMMCELGACIMESACGIALLQEPYSTNGVVRGLSGNFRVFTDHGTNAAIVV